MRHYRAVQAVDFVICELGIFFAFSWRDWSATTIPASIFAVGAVKHIDTGQHSISSIASNYLFLLLWLATYVYLFNLTNQIVGIEEDRINKPDRPLISGKVTLRGAKYRLCGALSVFISLAINFPVLLPESIGWLCVTVFLNLTSAGGHWFGKNFIAMSAGTWCLLTASWNMMALPTPASERCVLALSLWAGLTAQIQDVRDVEGDVAVGRRTMSVVFGDSAARQIITFLMLPAAIGVLWIFGTLHIAPMTLIGVHFVLGYRVMQSRGAHFDHKTYMVSPS